MKAVAICGSPRVGGNTEFLLKRCLETLSKSGVEGEFIPLAGKTIDPCRACSVCYKKKDKSCAQKDDDFQPVFESMLTADIIVVGSPVYFGSATPQMMALLDRAGYVNRANGHLLSRKIGGPITVARRAGQNFTYAQLLYWFTINDMYVAGSTYWNIAFGGAREEVKDDEEGLATVDRFAENLTWFAEKACPERTK